MKKLFLILFTGLLLQASSIDEMMVDSSTSTREFKSYVFKTLESFADVSEQQADINLKQLAFSSNQAEINTTTDLRIKNLSSELSDIKYRIMSLSQTSDRSKLDYIQQKVNQLDDKIWRLENSQKQLEDKIKTLERRIKWKDYY